MVSWFMVNDNYLGAQSYTKNASSTNDKKKHCKLMLFSLKMQYASPTAVFKISREHYLGSVTHHLKLFIFVRKLKKKS